MIHRRLWLAINIIKTALFLTDFGYHYLSRSLSPLVTLWFVFTSVHVTLMAGNPKGAKITSCLSADAVCHTRKIGSAHGKLFPSAVIFFASIRHTATNWKGLFFENFFLYLCFPRKLDYFAIIIKSCNDTGFHTPCVCANTTPLSMYSVTLPNEYKAFPSKRRLGIGINSRLFSSAWNRAKEYVRWYFAVSLQENGRGGNEKGKEENIQRD